MKENKSGNLFVCVQVQIPKKLTSEQKELFVKLADKGL
jgi:DnaJ-class molecular chaperone